jgi:hypothetical protein
MSENRREPEMIALESALTALAPRSAGIDRDQLMFQAGQRTARRNRWLAPCIAAVLASAATLSAVLLLHHPEPQIVRVPAATIAPPTNAPIDITSTNDRWLQCAEGLRLRNEVLQRGLDALPKAPITEEQAKPFSIESLFQ